MMIAPRIFNWNNMCITNISFIMWEKNDYQTGGSNLSRWKLVPTRREQEKWDKASKAATGGSVSHLFHNYMFYVLLLLSFHFQH